MFISAYTHPIRTDCSGATNGDPVKFHWSDMGENISCSWIKGVVNSQKKQIWAVELVGSYKRRPCQRGQTSFITLLVLSQKCDTIFQFDWAKLALILRLGFNFWKCKQILFVLTLKTFRNGCSRSFLCVQEFYAIKNQRLYY